MTNPETQALGPVYTRVGDFAVFNQFGVKLDFSDNTTDHEYYRWLDYMIGRISDLVSGAEIAEKSYARTEPRLNTGVYYDTDDLYLLRNNLVLRTTCNAKTHAFCAFKYGADSSNVRRDHRYSFTGSEKATIQQAPTSPESIAIVKKLLARRDIEHPGTHLHEFTGLTGDDLSPAIRLEQYRHPFFVWIDKHDALRCSMDRVQVENLRLPPDQRETRSFSEIELPIYPHIDESMAKDPRVATVIDVLAGSLRQQFKIEYVHDSKYQRAARTLGL